MNTTGNLRRPAGRLGRRAVLVVALLALGALAWFWGPLSSQAEAGAAYGARVGCSCRFVAGRSLEDCRKDFLPGMGLVSLSENEAEKSVTGRVFPVATETAIYREGAGCVFKRRN